VVHAAPLARERAQVELHPLVALAVARAKQRSALHFSAYCDPLFRPMETTSAHVNSNRTSKAMLAPALLDHLTREVI